MQLGSKGKSIGIVFRPKKEAGGEDQMRDGELGLKIWDWEA